MKNFIEKYLNNINMIVAESLGLMLLVCFGFGMIFKNTISILIGLATPFVLPLILFIIGDILYFIYKKKYAK